MENMDLINQPIEIKQEVEKHDEMDEIDNTAYMNSEKAYPYYGAQCDSIKIEEDTQNKQNGSDSDTLKREFIWMQANEQVFEAEIEKMKNENSIHHNVDPAQLAEESDSKVESGIIATSDSVQHRIKTELTGNYGGEDNSTTDAVDQVKIESQPVVEVKSEKLEEPYMDSMKFEDMDASQLNAELDIKCERDMSIMAGSSLDRATNKWEKELQDVYTEAEGELLFCYSCDYTTLSKVRLLQHISVDKCHIKTNCDKSQCARPLNVYICVRCNKAFKKKISLDEHILINHIEYIASISSKIHECKNCDYKTTDKFKLGTHMIAHHGADPKQCKYCRASFTCKQSLDNHIIQKHSDFIASVESKVHECSYCMYRTAYKDNLKQHLLVHSRTNSSSQQTCKHCNAAFKTIRNLYEHIIKQHRNINASIQTDSKQDLGKHLLKRRNSASSHSRIACQYCNATYKSERCLDNHMKKKHPGFVASDTEKMYECSYCAYKTTVNRYFNGHMRIHFSADVSTCKHCDATFKRQRSLDHIIKKHPELRASVTKKVHECSYCTYKKNF